MGVTAGRHDGGMDAFDEVHVGHIGRHVFAAGFDAVVLVLPGLQRPVEFSRTAWPTWPVILPIISSAEPAANAPSARATMGSTGSSLMPV